MPVARCVTIIAHVDHGKTSLADHLLSAGGEGLSGGGNPRLLDHEAIEEARGITVKAATAVLTIPIAKSSPPDHLVLSLVDSPGHVDFSREVSSALRVGGDGTLVVVDVLEGVRIQTARVVTAAIEAGSLHSSILVLNKCDKLFTVAKLEPLDACQRVVEAVAKVNATLATLAAAAQLSLPEDGLFCPIKGNVVFAGARDGWGFRLADFATMVATKMAARATPPATVTPAAVAAVTRALWHPEYHMDRKTQRIRRKPGADAASLAVSLVWRPVAAVFAAGEEDAAAVRSLAAKMGVSLPTSVRGDETGAPLVPKLLASWLPLAPTLCAAILQHVPDPAVAQRARLPAYFGDLTVGEGDDSTLSRDPEAYLASTYAHAEQAAAIAACDPAGPLVAHVGKVYAAPLDVLPAERAAAWRAVAPHRPVVLLGVARLLSGTLRPGQPVTILADGSDAPVRWTTGSVYRPAGRSVVAVPDAVAGSVVVLDSLPEAVLRSGTLLDPTMATSARDLDEQGADDEESDETRRSRPGAVRLFAGRSDALTQSEPVVRVAVRPASTADMAELGVALSLLARSDSAVRVSLSPSGEHIIAGPGELHLERCLDELQTRFAPSLSIVVSSPLVSYQETVTDALATRPSVQASVLGGLRDASDPAVAAALDAGTPTVRMTLDRLTVSVSAHPLPDSLAQALDDGSVSGAASFTRAWPSDTDLGTLLAVAPRRASTQPTCALTIASSLAMDYDASLLLDSYLVPISSGFSMAVSAGPLAEEPIARVVFRLDAVERSVDEAAGADADDGSDDEEATVSSVSTAAVTGLVRRACRVAMMVRECRLREPTFRAEVHVPADASGRVYDVLAKRRGRVTGEEVSEDGLSFAIAASLPVAGSFGLVAELAAATGGAAAPYLVFDSFRLLDSPLFFVPETEDEVEEDGDGASLVKSVGRRALEEVRSRKGLDIGEQFVVKADQQRTLSRKK